MSIKIYTLCLSPSPKFGKFWSFGGGLDKGFYGIKMIEHHYLFLFYFLITSQLKFSYVILKIIIKKKEE